MPVFVGKWRNRSIAASNPPADPPMPTIGQLNFAFAGFGLAFALGNFECDNFLPLVFTREEQASDFAFRFAAIGRIYVRLRLRITQVAIVQGGTRCTESADGTRLRSIGVASLLARERGRVRAEILLRQMIRCCGSNPSP